MRMVDHDDATFEIERAQPKVFGVEEVDLGAASIKVNRSTGLEGA